MAREPALEVKVWGDYACFTRPEMKVERVSYPVMTPSAARGVLEAIFWKPEMRWEVEEIHVLKPIRYFSILRNEVNSRASYRAAQGWVTSGGGFVATEDRSQRHTLALRDVEYRDPGAARRPGRRERPGGEVPRPVPAAGGERALLRDAVPGLPRVQRLFRAAGWDGGANREQR